MAPEKIYYHMATMPHGGRIRALEEVVPRILPQCDELHIYLNEFKTVPAFIINPKITILKSDDHIGDLGDVGKFYQCEKWKKGYHFTVDDDLLYPADYTDKMVAAIEKYNRKAVVSAHGRIFPDRPIKTYYKDYKVSRGCTSGFRDNVFVHDVGTGAMAFHIDTIPNLDLSIFKRKNISDIYFALYAQQNKIPLLNIARPRLWINSSNKYDEGYSICATCIRDDSFQTELINSIKKWTLWTTPVV